MVHHVNRTKDKNHLMFSIDAEKVFNKIECLSTIKNLTNEEYI
jgi:hypothetical protein